MTVQTILPPTRKQLFTLRTIIIIGLCSMAFFLASLLKKSVIGNLPLYWLLMVTFVFTCIKILYEWYHYWYITIPICPPHQKIFTIDIFTTFCAGEPYEMITETLGAIQKITYPHTAYLCDEADDPFLKDFCKKNGIKHVTRTLKTDAKAGNINNALKQATGELCLILDPDHVPLPEFLDPIVSHFNDPKIGFVQIVQAYSNGNQSLVAKGAAQQTYQFYGPMMMTMNKYGTVLAIGANCTFRRTALDSIGGHAAGLAEDMHTAMQLHAKGWRSVYVPKVLSKGLVPASMSAYYKQQIKWSRGVFELLVTAYVKLFSRFTWRQKFHYGIIPLFYLSGIVFMLNFLIPIFSLLLDTYPLKLGFSTFGIISLPFITSVVLVRHSVQRWLMADEERGFHVVGGLLLIGTWWVFNLGLLYTIIRKKIPYIPTPKHTEKENNLKINSPNIAVLGCSLIAIAYGLYNDWNPFTFLMATIAGLNCLIMAFVLLASVQLKFRQYKKQRPVITALIANLDPFKKRFWLLKQKVYSWVRTVPLLLTVLIVCFSFYITFNPTENKLEPFLPIKKKNIFLSGIYAPQQKNGLSSIKLVKDYQSGNKKHFDIISYYIAWGNQAQCRLPIKKLDSAYKNGSIPMITWEPWETLFEQPGTKSHIYNEKKVFSHIVKGDFDNYINSFAEQIKQLNKPVFIRFAHETDNPFYPWSATGDNTPEEFKKAWRYLRQRFIDKNVYNTIWVYNPWKPLAVADYFPGKDVVDWIGVTGLNFGSYNPDKKSYTFEQLYAPYHNLPTFKLGLPVMVAEMGSVKLDGKQDEWLQNGFKVIKDKFTEVKGIILFNSFYDNNLPRNGKGAIDWSTPLISKTSGILNNKITVNLTAQIFPQVETGNFKLSHQIYNNALFLNTHGVNYNKINFWYKNVLLFTKKTIYNDFTEMKKTGINTIKIYGPNIYDRITFEVATQLGLKIHYGFWIPEPAEFMSNPQLLADLKIKILNTVNDNKERENIVAWNIGNYTLQKLDAYYYKPELLTEQQYYLVWLRQLIKEIKQADPQRMVTVDILVSPTLVETASLLHNQIPEINSFGLVLTNDTSGRTQITTLKEPYFYSNAKAQAYLHFQPSSNGVFIDGWQDTQTASEITFNGLKDIWGRNKPELYQISKFWHGTIEKNDLPEIKILRPAQTTYAGSSLPYHALIYLNNNWHFAKSFNTGLNFEWYLVKTDGREKAISMKEVGKGPDINILIPTDMSLYRLYVIASKGQNISTTESILNIPLVETPILK